MTDRGRSVPGSPDRFYALPGHHPESNPALTVIVHLTAFIFKGPRSPAVRELSVSDSSFPKLAPYTVGPLVTQVIIITGSDSGDPVGMPGDLEIVALRNLWKHFPDHGNGSLDHSIPVLFGHRFSGRIPIYRYS